MTSRKRGSSIFDKIVCIGILSIVILCTFISLVAIFFAVYMPDRILKDITGDSGFYACSQKATFNIFTGKAAYRNLEITNPEEYSDSKFLNAKEFILVFNPLKFLTGKFEISGLEIDSASLKCIRLSGSKNNIEDFLKAQKIAFKFAQDESFKSVKIEISDFSFADISDKDHPFYRNGDASIKIELSDISDKKHVCSEILKSFRNANAEFMISGVSDLRN